ncbi:MAG: Gfo/Idh/MocA family oxidoreductase [bacterium]|nr:Gfo/Idh/MocA family oxidoreductase [bacterium]
MKNTVNLGIVGLGYWGPKLIDKFQSIPQAKVTVICDLDPGLLGEAEKVSGIKGTTKISELLDNSKHQVDAVIVVTPPATHLDIARQVLEAGKHVYIEKPMTVTKKGAVLLNNLAKKKHLNIFIDHTFCHDAVFIEKRKLIDEGKLGEIYHSRFEWLGARAKPQGPDVLWDSGPHAFSSMLFLIGKKPVSLHMNIIERIPDTQTPSALEGEVHFEDGTRSEIKLAWKDQTVRGLHVPKAARASIVGKEKTIIYEGSFAGRTARIYPTEESYSPSRALDACIEDFLGGKGDELPGVSYDDEPLKSACAAFIDLILSNKVPVTDGFFGEQVVHLLEKASESMRSRGRHISL